MTVSFSDQIWILWKAVIHDVAWSVWFTRNRKILDDKPVDFRLALSLVWRAVKDANRLSLGCMRNSVDELLIHKHFGLRGRPPHASVIKSVFWSPPSPGWVKVNTDEVALGSPDAGGYGGVFRNCRSFIKGCFAALLDLVFAFEAGLLAVSMAINYAWINDWRSIWLESDSS
ncbi:hypothetical protein Dsin_029164 [Dipteronia sinensis]|uniref:RNase H type-1 domain-containing protein n=1 Tax=Dipteronia sinensis TaxID=43782 RepID=A0AAD9ZS31_9ROSI|nr:hypothetical protein Dsin_029164 [Dipteronia sinensis]